ncbi:hypothetical protein BLA29_009963, partial [Euroglyphus maynei]
MDEPPHYFPSKNDFPYFGHRNSCQITMKHDVLGDNFHFPVFNQSVPGTGVENPVQTYGRIPQDIQQQYSKLRNDHNENPVQLLRAKFREKKNRSNDEVVYGERINNHHNQLDENNNPIIIDEN